MWGKNAAAPLNAVHLGYGIGAVLVNLLVRPFLSEKKLLRNDLNQTLLLNNSMNKDSSNIFVPYSITAILCLFIGFGHLFFYIKEQQNQRQRLNIQQVIK